jgi:threonine synthase
MDVGNPSNFIRIQELYNNDFEELRQNLSAYSFSDDETKAALLSIYEQSGYIADPHGAVGYLGCKSYQKEHPQVHTVFLETAHPTKFLDVVEDVIPEQIALPPQIQAVIDKEKVATFVKNYSEFKSFLLEL